jgi:glycosyltransferase involved in cell wall biosynthesis
MINFISNLPQDLRSGGFSAMNVAALETVRKCGEVHYVGPINPGVSLYRKVVSKALRTFGRPGEFFFFSRERLSSIQQEVHSKCSPSASLDFYHGFTPWVLAAARRPYITWSDCTFHDYLRIYHDPADFSSEDIRRIEEAEARWLAKAERVLFTSHWGAASACKTYGLSASKTGVVGLFGEVDPPDADAYQGDQSFLFVSTNFEAKGGRVVLEAFRQLRVTHPEATLTIIGDSPSNCHESGVTLTGFLRKEVPVEAAKFLQLFAQARAVVHPTRSDILPLMLVEAGYFGMPVIASRRFAIPELVADGVNGLLIDDPSNADEISLAMEKLLDDTIYLPMRKSSWMVAHSAYSRQQFESSLADQIHSVMTNLS